MKAWFWRELGAKTPPPPVWMLLMLIHIWWIFLMIDFSVSLTGKSRFKCDQDGTCEISSRNLRNSCKACRLNKCQQLGMSESHFQNIQWYHFSFNFLSFFFKILNNNHLQDTWAKMEKNRVVYHIWKSKSQKKSKSFPVSWAPLLLLFFFFPSSKNPMSFCLSLQLVQEPTLKKSIIKGDNLCSIPEPVGIRYCALPSSHHIWYFKKIQLICGTQNFHNPKEKSGPGSWTNDLWFCFTIDYVCSLSSTFSK